MTQDFVKRLSSPTLLTSLMRLTLREGATCGAMGPSDPGRIERIVMLRDELRRRLDLLGNLGEEARHVAAHLDVLALKLPELTHDDLTLYCVPRLKKLAAQTVRN